MSTDNANHQDRPQIDLENWADDDNDAVALPATTYSVWTDNADGRVWWALSAGGHVHIEAPVTEEMLQDLQRHVEGRRALQTTKVGVGGALVVLGGVFFLLVVLGVIG